MPMLFPKTVQKHLKSRGQHVASIIAGFIASDMDGWIVNKKIKLFKYAGSPSMLVMGHRDCWSTT